VKDISGGLTAPAGGRTFGESGPKASDDTKKSRIKLLVLAGQALS